MISTRRPVVLSGSVLTIFLLRPAPWPTTSPSRSRFSIAASALLIGLSPSVASAAAVIYEGFADSNASLTGNATGTGLTGNWAGDSRPTVVSNLTFGSLETSGNAVNATGAWYANNATIDTASSAYTNLLADSGEMWFSMLYRVDSGSGRFYMTIGSDTLSANGGLSAGQAIGFAVLREQFMRDSGNPLLGNPLLGELLV